MKDSFPVATAEAVAEMLNTELQGKYLNMASQLYWSLSPSDGTSHAIIFDLGGITFSRLKAAYKWAFNISSQGSNIKVPLKVLIPSEITKSLTKTMLNNFIVVPENHISLITLSSGKSTSNPYTAFLSNGRKIEYLSITRMTMFPMAKDSDENVKNLRRFKRKYCLYTFDRLINSLESAFVEAAKELAMENVSTEA